ncbi:hypothetical protein [Anabaena azotica]|uniref:Transcriptional regulator n=1 Tax=Anabaena azotica FACHB-119 TaxID=947527 RepID=A0ABR8DFG7_9NOST|nr:hypothetical protein [Anabaena azotica]MBD2505145.1 hypothetical protein [Anabaena azotica FACHB-119]
MESQELIQVLDIAELFRGLGFSDRFFLTRQKGTQAFERLKDYIQKQSEGNAILLCFPRDQLIDVSFIDETIIRLLEDMNIGHCPNCTLLLQGLTPDTIANLGAAIEFRHLKLAFLVVELTGKWQCIGQIELSLRETLNLLAIHGSLTAPELSEILKLAINSASNRLKRLYDLHLIRRDYEVTNKGLQYTYYFWKWTE